MEKPEDESIMSIAATKWSMYGGDLQVMHYVEKLHGEEAHAMVRDALQANFVEGFKQGFLLRLRGEET